MSETDWDEVARELEARSEELEGLEVDLDRTRALAADIAAGRSTPERNRLPRSPEPPGESDVDDLESLSADSVQHYSELGRAAMERGEVGVTVLNGGMATRFGGGVKGIVEVLDGRSFLELKLAQARRRGPLPFLCMDSFATHRATLDFAWDRGIAGRIESFLQSVAMRLTPEGAPFRDPDGRLSLYAPGHGDFPQALRRSGMLFSLRSRGVRALTLSNVDNLGAEPDPVVVGYHLAHGRPLTVEVARTIPGDAGGGLARVDGRLQLVEGFRFPPGFPLDSLPFVNTNTFVFALEALEAEHPLTWFHVEKNVDGRIAIQMERLVGEVSRFVETAYLCVPRSGAKSRYFPVKTRDDLEALRADPLLVERFCA